MAMERTMIAARTQVMAVIMSLEETCLDLEVFGRLISEILAGNETSEEGEGGGGGGGGER